MTLEPRARNFRFGSFAVDTGRRLLLRGGAIVPLSSKTFDLLVALIEGREALITKQELLARVWPNQFIEEGNLTVHVSTLRKALGELRGEHRYIATIPGRGYRFVAEVREGGAAVEEPVNHDAHDAAP
ncbi:MAG: transcriptional regulator, partial [bacterium]